MSEKRISWELELEVADIKSTQDRILDHHKEFKQDIKDIKEAIIAQDKALVKHNESMLKRFHEIELDVEKKDKAIWTKVTAMSAFWTGIIFGLKHVLGIINK